MNERALTELIKNRRTRKPSTYSSSVPNGIISKLIDFARHAPNHHRTEPARFYLLDRKRILKLAKLFGETLRGDGSNPSLIEKARKKEKDWGTAHGLLVITSYTDKDSALVRKNPTVLEENFATACCITQNLLLLFESSKISAKWSTGAVWKHPAFASTIGIKHPAHEKFVAFIFYGYSEWTEEVRNLSPLENHLINYTHSSIDF
jgi:nitroreductase